MKNKPTVHNILNMLRGQVPTATVLEEGLAGEPLNTGFGGGTYLLSNY